MGKQVQIEGADTATLDQLLGVIRQIMVDTSRNELRVMDGVTPGGNRIPNINTVVQLISEIAGLGSSSTPIGQVAAYAMSSVPANWLECNGQAISRTNYAVLFSLIATTYGVGDGVTTFNLPDLRGYFIRGWDHGRGIDAGRAIATSQADANLAHSHAGSTADSGGAHTHTLTIAAGGTHNHTISSPAPNQGFYTLSGSATGYQAVANGNNSDPLNINVASGGSHNHSGSADSGGAHTHTLTIASSGGTEARPKNIAMMYCICVQ